MVDYLLIANSGHVRPVILVATDTATVEPRAVEQNRTRFRAARNRAFADGNADAVAEVHAILREYARTYGFADIDLRSQLKREYGVDVGESALEEAPPAQHTTVTRHSTLNVDEATATDALSINVRVGDEVRSLDLRRVVLNL